MIILFTKNMGTGNKLHHYATFLAFCKEYNVRLWNASFFPETKYFNRYFNISIPFISFFIDKILEILKNVFYKFGRLIIKLKLNNSLISAIDIGWETPLDLNSIEFCSKVKSTKLLFLFGWQYRYPEGLVKHEKFIKDFFTLRQCHEINVSKSINELRKRYDLIVGIHIRQGDYKKFENGKYFYTDNDYFKIIENLKILFKDINFMFLICSNEKSFFNFLDTNNVNYFKGAGNVIEDMYLFSKCDYLIGPPSTFTMWSSFVGSVPLFMVKSKLDYPKDLKEFKIYK